MSKPDPLNKLGQAQNLLATLECFTLALAKEPVEGVPWAGLCMTLQQCRDLVKDAQSALVSGDVFDEETYRIEEAGLAEQLRRSPKLLRRLRPVNKSL